jgi:hypothetical protein
MANPITFQVVTLRLTGLKGRVAIIPGAAQAWRRISIRAGHGGRQILYSLHTGAEDSGGAWQDFHRVRQPLERWEKLPPKSLKEAILRFGLDVQKIASPHSDPATAVLHYLRKLPQDLITRHHRRSRSKAPWQAR